MITVRALSDVRHEKNSVVTVGTFDGVHSAHREIIREAVNRAKMREGRSVVMTFDPHPKEVVSSPRGGDVRLLSTVNERLERFGSLGVEYAFVIPFTAGFSQLTAHSFFEDYVVRGTGVSEVVVGYDHMFGRGRTAGIEDLVRMGKEFDFSVFAVSPFAIDGEAVSSTKIRRALALGDTDHARRLLGYPYSLAGRVVKGDGRGAARLGFPTANLTPESLRKVVPARGVYVVQVWWKDRTFHGMMNIGVRPTVTAGQSETLEVHIFDFSGDLYGESLRVAFLKRLRDERRFASVAELVDQLHADRAQSLEYLSREHQKSVDQRKESSDVS